MYVTPGQRPCEAIKGGGSDVDVSLNTVDMTLTNKNKIEHFPKRPLQ